VYKVKSKGAKRGELQTVGHFHTRGETPRHFQFDNSGQYLIVANQDTDSIAVFNFNLSNGELKYSGNEYRVPSPNFVCCCPSYQDDEEYVKAPEVGHPLLSSNISTCSDSGSDTDESTVPVRGGTKSEMTLKQELAQARLEIEQLKRMLAEKI